MHVINATVSSSTVTVPSSTDPEINVVLEHLPLANLTSVAIQLPTSPIDGQKVKLSSNVNVGVSGVTTQDTSTIIAHYGQSSIGAGFSGGWTLIYDQATDAWYPGV